MTLSVGTQSITSERLLLRRIDARDLDFFIRIHENEHVARYIGAGNPRLRAETEKWFSDIQDSYRNANLGQLAVFRKEDGQIVGRCGLSDAAVGLDIEDGKLRKGWFFSAHVPKGTNIELLPELGYTFGKEYWGQGFASEAARLVYQYAQTELSFPKIMSVVHAGNVASRAVVEKFGVEYIDCLEMAGRSFERFHWPLLR
jgi:[ribosomal protein S5]-alanine N-acetyltransferase